MNLYEIRLEDNIIYNDIVLDAFLFDCQCALFLVDGKNKKSINSIKDILAIIDNEKYPFMKRIIVENKLDIMPEKENEEIKKLLNFYQFLDKAEISLKTGNNFENLFPLDKITKYALKDYPKEEYEASISLILLGDNAVGKSCFMNRYVNNEFNLNYLMTIGMNQEIKPIKIENNNIPSAFL